MAGSLCIDLAENCEMKKTTAKKDKAANAFAGAADILGGAGGIDALFATESDKGSQTFAFLDQIHIKPQVRTEFEDDENKLAELADSIRGQGVLQPILLRPIDGPAPFAFELIAGERRVRAAALAGLTQIPAFIREMTDEETEAAQLAENIQRKNLTQIEEAAALQRRLDGEFNGDVGSLLAAINKSNAWLSKRLSLLKLPEQSKRLITERISADLEVINAVKGIEKSDPAAAQELIDDLKTTRGKTDARAQVAAVKEKVKPKAAAPKGSQDKPKKPTNKAGKKEEQTDIFASAKNDKAGEPPLDAKALLNGIYSEIYDASVTPSMALKAIGKQAKEIVELWLQSYYDAGLKARDVSRAVIQGFRSGSFASDGEGAFALAAFLYGADSEGKFNMLNILGSVKA